MGDLKNIKFFLKFSIFVYIFVHNLYTIVPIVLMYRVYCHLNIFIPVIYTKNSKGNKNIQMYVSPIKQHRYSFVLMLFDIFVVSPKQTGFLINYIYLAGFYKYTTLSVLIKNLLKLVGVVVIVSVLGIPYLLYRLVSIMINNVLLDGVVNLEYNTYKAVREQFTYGVDFNELSIRVFDGFVKLNMFFIKKSNVEKLSSVLKSSMQNKVNERYISLGSNDFIHSDISLISGNTTGIALSLSHNSPVKPILLPNEVLGLKQTGFLLDPQNLTFIKTVKTNNINSKYSALRVITLSKLASNKQFLVEGNNIATGSHKDMVWSDHNHKFKIDELLISEDFKTIEDLIVSNAFDEETLKTVLHASSNQFEKKVWDYVYN